MKNKLAPRFKINDKLLRFKGGGVVKFQQAGKFPTGTQAQYDHVTTIYQSLVDKGVNPQAALDLVNQKIAEKGWKGWVTGDNKRYPTVDAFTDHLIDWHGRMYPSSIDSSVKNFDTFYEGVNGTKEQNDRARRSKGKDNSGRNYYNTEKTWEGYRQDLLKVRPGVKKRINYYRSLQGLPPLAYQNPAAMEDSMYVNQDINIT